MLRRVSQGRVLRTWRQLLPPLSRCYEPRLTQAGPPRAAGPTLPGRRLSSASPAARVHSQRPRLSLGPHSPWGGPDPASSGDAPELPRPARAPSVVSRTRGFRNPDPRSRPAGPRSSAPCSPGQCPPCPLCPLALQPRAPVFEHQRLQPARCHPRPRHTHPQVCGSRQLHGPRGGAEGPSPPAPQQASQRRQGGRRPGR